MHPNHALSNAQIARAVLIVLLGFLASGILGFLRTLIISAQFGTSEALDAFYTAQRIPEFIFVLVAGGALGSSFIPVYAKSREQDPRQAWQLASAVTTLAALSAGVLGLGVALVAPQLVRDILLPDRSAQTQQLTANLMRLMMVTPFIFSISGLIMGILQSHGLFVLPSLAIGMNSIGIIIGALVIAPSLPPTGDGGQIGNNNIYGLAYGAVLSALLHLAVQLPGLRRIGASLRPLFAPTLPGVRAVLLLMGPRVLGLAVVQINFVVNIILTSPMREGSLTALQTAYNLMFFALGIIGQSVGSAVFPSLAALAAEGDMDGYRDRLSRAMRSVLFLALPATAAFVVFGEPIVAIFERGQWTVESTSATAWALAFYALGMAGFALLEILSRAFYALSDTWTPVVVGIAIMLSNIALSLLFVRLIGDSQSLARGPFAGLALANSATTLVEALILWALLRRRIHGLNDRQILALVWKAGLASLLMGGTLAIISHAMPRQAVWVQLFFGGAVGGAVFFGSALWLGLAEARAIPALIRQRLGGR